MARSFPNAVETKSIASAKRRAFTLVELMVVIGLIGIMTAMILPEMRGTYENALLRSASRELINAFHLAHSRALTVGQAHRVRMEPTSGNFLIEKQIHRLGAPEFIPAADITGGAGKLDSRIRVEFRAPETGDPETFREPNRAEAQTHEPAVTFFTDGTADAREVLLQDRQGFRLLLYINPITARVRVVEPPRS